MQARLVWGLLMLILNQSVQLLNDAAPTVMAFTVTYLLSVMH